jgi:hypothetical protein
MLVVIMLSVFTLVAITLSVFMLIVVGPQNTLAFHSKK